MQNTWNQSMGFNVTVFRSSDLENPSWKSKVKDVDMVKGRCHTINPTSIGCISLCAALIGSTIPLIWPVVYFTTKNIQKKIRLEKVSIKFLTSGEKHD